MRVLYSSQAPSFRFGVCQSGGLKLGSSRCSLKHAKGSRILGPMGTSETGSTAFRRPQKGRVHAGRVCWGPTAIKHPEPGAFCQEWKPMSCQVGSSSWIRACAVSFGGV